MSIEKMKYEFETNRMLNIFKKYYKFKILKNALDEVKSDTLRNYLLFLLNGYNHACNIAVKCLNEINKLDDEIYDYFVEFYLNAINCKLIELEITSGIRVNISISEIYKEKYIIEMNRNILEFWNENSYEDFFCSDRTFIKMFDEIHDYALVRYKDIFVKKTKHIKTLFRCQRNNHFGDYLRMLPNKKYCKNNRWSEDGVPYLYLGCSYDKNASDFNQVIKTCFREIRLKDDEYATVCRFKWIDDKSKLFNLYISNEERLKEEKLVNKLFDSGIERLQNDNDFINKLIQLKNSNKESEIRELIEKKAKDNRDKNIISRMVSTQLMNIIKEAIFKPVDEKIEDYIPFRVFAEYLKRKDYDGILYKSTQMEKNGEEGMNVVLFNNNATYEEGTMQVYHYLNNEYIKVK